MFLEDYPHFSILRKASVSISKEWYEIPIESNRTTQLFVKRSIHLRVSVIYLYGEYLLSQDSLVYQTSDYDQYRH